MRPNILFTIALGVFICITGCNESSVSPNNPLQSSYADTVTAQITPGVTLALQGFRDVYSLDDSVAGYLVIKNEIDLIPFYLHTYQGPAQSIRVFPVNSNDIVYYFPEFSSPAEWYDTLKLGDVLTFQCLWPRNTWDQKATTWTTLKPFSGTYKFVAWLDGNPLLRPDLTKFITISESGEPLSAWLRPDYQSTDSLKADLVIRNSILRQIALESIEPNPVRISFLGVQDTLLTLNYPLPATVKNVPPHSDIVAFPIRFGRRDTLLAPMNGVFHMQVQLRLKDRQLWASAFRYLP